MPHKFCPECYNAAGALEARIAELEAALKPFGDAYRFTKAMGDFMRQQYLSSMTVTGKCTAQDFHRAAELTSQER